MTFHELHQQASPLILCNVWDVKSVKLAEKLDYQAVGTSSAAIAAMLGYEDGENISFSELEFFVKHIANATTLPLSVDIEAGYSRDPANIVDHVKTLASLGVVGINIEDSIVGSNRELSSPGLFSETISTIKSELQGSGQKVFINARTDTFLIGCDKPLEETKKRLDFYQEAGADGIFVPCIEKESDIEALVAASDIPVNVMCMPKLPSFATLADLGVKRISMGNFLFDTMYNQLEHTMTEVRRKGSFSPIF